jgi:hypothetical protein
MVGVEPRPCVGAATACFPPLMDRKLSSRLTLIYPPAWRARYGDEFIYSSRINRRRSAQSLRQLPAGWPPVSVRLVLSSITLALLIIGLLVSGLSVEHAIRRTDLTRHRRRWFTTTASVFALSMLLMTVGMVAWGWLAERYATEAFHAGDGLLLDISMGHAWMASAIAFGVSSAMALKASRCAFQNV